MEGRKVRIAMMAIAGIGGVAHRRRITRGGFLLGRLCVVAILAGLSPSRSPASEIVRGHLRANQFPSCSNGCDWYRLEPDSGFSVEHLKKDLNSTVDLNSYVDMHVEITGYRAGCGGCSEFFVLNVAPLSTDGVADEKFLPGGFTLRQNYPNPFNPATIIEYSLKSDVNVKLTVFDLLGRQVSTLVQSNQPTGHYRVAWDASGQPDGIYFYRLLTSGGEGRFTIQTKAMLLLR